jgi:hypothetical protein
MESFTVRFAPLRETEYEYQIIQRQDDTFMILVDGVETCSIQMSKDGTDIWETCSDSGLTDEEIDFLARKIRHRYS